MPIQIFTENFENGSEIQVIGSLIYEEYGTDDMILEFFSAPLQPDQRRKSE